MADVRRPPKRPRERGESDTSRSRDADSADRGQLFLVGALSLAVLFVGFALLLNTAIFTENLATRNTDPGTDPSISYRSASEEAVREIMIRENRNGSDPTWNENTLWFQTGVDDWNEAAGLHAARRARAVSVSVDSTNGTRFEQTNSSRTLTNRTGSADWTLGTSTGAVRDAHLFVNRDSLTDANITHLFLGPDPYEMVFEDTGSGKTWHVYVYDDSDLGGDDVTVAVEDGDGNREECGYQHTGATAHIDLANASINGTDCPAFDRLDLPDSAVDAKDIELRFENGDQVTGTYEIKVAAGADITDNVYDNENTGDHDNGAAFVTAIIYEADVTISYESTDVTYETTIRIAPEELR